MLSEILRSLRKEKGLTQQEVADKIGVSSCLYNKYEKKDIRPQYETLKNLAELYGVTIDYLMGDTLTRELPKVKNARPLSVPIKLPVFGEIRAGVPINTNQTPTDEMIFADDKFGDGNHFVLEVHGDSMINAGIPDGSFAIIRGQNYAESGQIVACIVDGENATLKRYLPQKNGSVILKAESPNPDAKSYVLNASDILSGNATIIGVLRTIKKDFS